MYIYLSIHAGHLNVEKTEGVESRVIQCDPEQGEYVFDRCSSSHNACDCLGTHAHISRAANLRDITLESSVIQP